MPLRKISLRIAALALCCLFYSCSQPEYLSEEDLSRYVLDEDNGLSVQVHIDDTKIQMTYRPTDLLVAQELKNVSNLTTSLLLEKREKYGHHYYFILSLSNSGKDVLSSPANQAGFSELLQTISFRMNEVVSLTTSKRDTIPVAGFLYNRTFGLSNSTDVLLVFDRTETKASDWVEISIDEFGLGIGKQSVRFKIKDLEDVPKINFEKMSGKPD